jgi:G:T-mismatch repair DNA endonuclease (very short patch repair protein)
MSIREELNLSAYGFLSEQIIDWYVADELHPDRKIIIEINGDFWHANPDKYSENDIIKAPGESFVAGDKWKKDMEKYKKYVELGYELIVIWESDYKEDKTLSLYKERLSHLFGF